MKRFGIACSALFFLSFHATAQTYLNCDFEEGIPSSFTLVDNDGNKPSSDAVKQGFAVGTPWLAKKPTGKQSNVAVATSWYSPSGKSDDWMITPAFTVDADNVRLSWRGRSSMKSDKYHESYSVYVSTTGGKTVNDFDKSHPLFTTTGETYAWTNHQVDLSAYKGKKISLAFVDESNNKAYLYIDDVNVSVWSNLTIKSTIGKQVYLVDSVMPKATVTNRSDADVNGFTVSLNIDGKTETKAFADVLKAGASEDITLDEPLFFGKHEAKPYTLSVSDAATTYVVKDTVTSYQRKILGEEYTGTWCAYCVRGIVALNKLRETADDWFVGIAVHSDEAFNNNYIKGISSIYYPSGLPNGFMDRKYSGIDPGDFELYGKRMLATENVFSSMDVTAAVPDFSVRSINTKTTLYFGANYPTHHFRLGYVIVENNVHHPDDAKYHQNNAIYSKGEDGVMGGWEKLPSTVEPKDMWFQEVGRWVDEDIDGLDLLPAAIEKDKAITVSHTVTIPDSVAIDTLQNCDLVVMLIDASDHHVVNVERVPLSAQASPLVDVAARYLSLYGSATGVAELRQNSNAAPQTYYSPDGRRLAAPRKGINIVKYADGTSRVIIQ
ncbi:MAG: choice-of-anchor J domain-containing protein [Prevotella sp.]|nr:choice-of-anchor J domain-containing protein [Prevotella sp.]